MREAGQPWKHQYQQVLARIFLKSPFDFLNFRNREAIDSGRALGCGQVGCEYFAAWSM